MGNFKMGEGDIVEQQDLLFDNTLNSFCSIIRRDTPRNKFVSKQEGFES
jgi:hypothetical protein